MTNKNNATNVATTAQLYVEYATEWDKNIRSIKKMISVFKTKKFDGLRKAIFGDERITEKKLATVLTELGIMDEKGKVTWLRPSKKGEVKVKTRKYTACSWTMVDFTYVMFLVGACKVRNIRINELPCMFYAAAENFAIAA